MSMSKTMKSGIPLIILVVFAGTSIAPLLSTNITEFTPYFEGTAQLSNSKDPALEGSSTRLYENSTYTLSISTNLNSPTEGSHYEGWIVRLSPFKTIDIGQLTQSVEGKWELNYQEQNPQTDYETFTTILVTEESNTEAATIPNEIHTLEGTF